MNLQQALITAKAFFPEAYIETFKDKDGEHVYLMQNVDTILVSIKEPGGLSEVCWCPFMPEPKRMMIPPYAAWWRPVKKLTEKQFVGQLRRMKEDSP